MYHPQIMLDLLAANIKKTSNPFAIPAPLLNTWYKECDVDLYGEYLLFTGFMYQMVPYIEMVSNKLEKLEDKPLAKHIDLGKFIPKFLSGVGLAALTPSRLKSEYNKILSAISKLLHQANVSFYYRPDLDLYSGILLYDLGDVEVFKQHALKVAQALDKAHVKKIITVDPHTTYALKVLYPKYTGLQFEIKTYFELLAFSNNDQVQTSAITIHDPCFYGRYLELSDVPRKILHTLGCEIDEVEENKQFTHCCGGPAESILPKLSAEIRERRMQQLDTKRKTIVTMCPICLANLRKTNNNVHDLATFIANRLHSVN